MEILIYIWNIIGSNMEAIIAVCALFLTVYQLKSSQKYNRLSVTPHIASYSETTEKNNNAIYEFLISNNGIGPAEIETWDVLLENKDIKETKFKNMGTYVNSVMFGRNSQVTIGALSTGHLMSIGEVRKVLIVKTEINSENDFIEIERNLNKLDLKINYKSIYGDNYTLNTERIKGVGDK